MERRPRSVRQRVVASTTANRRAGDSGCPEVAKKGNVVGIAPLSACTERSTTSSSALGDASFAWSSDSCTSILTTHRRSNPRWWGERWASWLGKLAQAGGTSTGVHRSDEARLATRHRLRKEEGVTRKKRKEIEVSVPRGPRARVWLPARRYVVVAEVGRRRLVSNKLGKRAPKRAVRVE